MRALPFTSIRAKWILAVITIAACFAATNASVGIEPRPEPKDAQWAGETWGQLHVVPAVTKPGYSVTARAVVVGGPAGDPSWHCSQYSGWVAAGTSTIAIVIPDEWSFTSTDGFVRAIGGRVALQTSDAGDMPPYGWEDRISDTCYCYIETFGASGGCETREVAPLFASAYQQEFVPQGTPGEWLTVSGEFSGWNGVAYGDYATGYVMILDDSEEFEDSDDDGIADEWELAYFGDLTTASDTSSYDDGDDVDDFTEFSRWRQGTLDSQGTQYDPMAKNTVNDNGPSNGSTNSSSNDQSSGPACGAASPMAMGMCLLGLTLLSMTRSKTRP